MVSFSISFFLNFLIIPFIRKYFNRKNFLKVSFSREKNTPSKIRLGGIGIFLATLIGYFFSLDPVNNSFYLTNEFNLFLIYSSFFFLFGLMDDIFQLSPFIRLAGQLITASIMWLYTTRINLISIDFGFFSFGEFNISLILSYLFTIFWIVGIINAINWIDGLDGLAAGFSFLVSITFYISSINSGNILCSFLSASLAGASLAFLFFNLYPSKIIMGDCGSNFLGYSLAIMSLNCFQINEITILNSSFSIFPHLLIFLIPIFDMIFVIFSRFRKSISIFLPDKNHIHHRLLNNGFDEPSTTFIILVFTQILCLISLLKIKGDLYFLALLSFGLFNLFIYKKTNLKIKKIIKNILP